MGGTMGGHLAPDDGESAVALIRRVLQLIRTLCAAKHLSWPLRSGCAGKVNVCSGFTLVSVDRVPAFRTNAVPFAQRREMG